MFKNLFKPRQSIDHPDPVVRKEVLDKAKDLPADKIADLARNDPDITIRKSALVRADSVSLFAEFLDHEHLGNFCRTHLAQRIDDQHSLAHDLRILPIRLSSIADPQKIVDGLYGIDSSADRAKILVAIPDRTLRLATTNLVRDERTLVELEKLSRTKDKRLNRLIREKLLEFKNLEGTREELLTRGERLIDTATRTSATHAHYDAQRTAVEKDWELFLKDVHALNTRLSAVDRVPIELNTLEQRFPDRLSSDQRVRGERPHFDAILKQLQECSLTEGAIEECEQNWLNALKVESAPKAIADQFYQLANARRRDRKRLAERKVQRAEIEKLTKPINFREPDSGTKSWRNVWEVQRRAKSRLREVQQTIRKLHSQQRNENTEDLLKMLTHTESSLKTDILDRIHDLTQQIVVQIESNFTALNKFLENGELQRARSAERNIGAMIQRLPRTIQGKYKSQLTPISAEINKLLGWQQFAESPKRQVLCEEVEELVENPQSPQAQFHRIRDLRDAWNQLGPVRSRADREYQARYETAAEAAFKVCESWFEQLAAVRAKNLAERTSICESLESFLVEYDWDHPDWKVVNKTIRTAQSEWRKLVPIDKRNAKKIGVRFREISGKLEDKLEVHWTDRADKKQQLIDELKEALANDNLTVGELVDFVKQTQERWRQVGSAGNQREQPLWEEFRRLCDEAFDSLTTQREQRRSEININIEQGEQIVNELAASVHAENSSESEVDLASVKQARTKITKLDLPQRVRERLNEQLKEISTEVQKRTSRLENEQKISIIRKLLELDDMIADVEQKGDDVSEELLKSVPGAIDLFQSRTADIANKNSIVIHELVLRAEVLADVLSPEEDSGKRMQVQVSRLQHGLTHGGESAEQRLESLIQEWCKLAFGEQQLRPRFHSAIRKHLDSLVD